MVDIALNKEAKSNEEPEEIIRSCTYTTVLYSLNVQHWR